MANLPGINVAFSDGNLNRVTPTEDGVCLCIANAYGPVPTSTLIKVTSIKEVEEAGILPTIQDFVLHKRLKEFFEEAGNGTVLWLWLILDVNSVNTELEDGQELIDAISNIGNVSLVFTIDRWADGDYTYQNPLSVYHEEKVIFAEIFANACLELNIPVVVILDCVAFRPNSERDQYDYRVDNFYSRVCQVIGDTNANPIDIDFGSASHLLAARLSKIQVHENPGKVKLGALKVPNIYFGTMPFENARTDVSQNLHGLGYITFRKHIGRSGYYFTDDTLLADPESDVTGIALRRTLDKAYKIALITGTREVLNDFDVTNDGTISPLYAATIESAIENAIFTQMTARGELSRDATNKDDLGVQAVVDTTNNVVLDSRISMKLRVRPKGYARFIEIDLGFDTNLNN